MCEYYFYITLTSCSFSYLGEPRRGRGRGVAPPTWKPAWEDDRRFPAAVRIEMVPTDEDAQLDPITLVAQVQVRYAPPGGQKNWRPDLNFGEIVEGPNGPVLRRRADVPPDPNPRPY